MIFTNVQDPHLHPSLPYVTVVIWSWSAALDEWAETNVCDPHLGHPPIWVTPPKWSLLRIYHHNSSYPRTTISSNISSSSSGSEEDDESIAVISALFLVRLIWLILANLEFGDVSIFFLFLLFVAANWASRALIFSFECIFSNSWRLKLFSIFLTSRRLVEESLSNWVNRVRVSLISRLRSGVLKEIIEVSFIRGGITIVSEAPILRSRVDFRC